LAGVILAVVGSTNIFSSDPSEVSTGLHELRAAVCLFLSVFIADVLITGYTFARISHVQAGERRLLFAVAASLPFMATRMLYSLLCAFANDPKWFSSWSLEWTAILVHGTMGVLMEAVIVVIFITAGLMTAPIQRSTVAPSQDMAQSSKIVYGPGVLVTRMWLLTKKEAGDRCTM
jgi:hypothetical protein